MSPIPNEAAAQNGRTMRSINDPKPEVPTTDPDDEINALIERIDTVLAEVEEQMEAIVGRGSGTAAAE